ncbi:hypothetical protein AB0D65_25000 [Streptomyces griseoloalbus]|uniref:Uncharacterized protein n=1 Tax=Streptomyces griseoloalbus TaxID=67303 RepID=A0ABV3EAF8_9ACTN
MTEQCVGHGGSRLPDGVGTAGQVSGFRRAGAAVRDWPVVDGPAVVLPVAGRASFIVGDRAREDLLDRAFAELPGDLLSPWTSQGC